MSLQTNKTILSSSITTLVVVVVLGSFALSGAAVVENLRFVKATSQILEPVGLVRTIIAQQPGFIQKPGENIWDDLARVEQIPSGSDHVNPWGSDVHVVAATNVAIRIESDLPTHDCRRMALYFINQAQGFRLLAVEAQPFEQVLWSPIYPMPENTLRDSVVDVACGKAHAARLALVFKVR